MRHSLRSLCVLAALSLLLVTPAVAADTAPQLFQDADFAYRSLDVQQQTYLYNFVDSPTIERSRLVRLAAAPNTLLGKVRIELFPGEEITVEHSRLEERGETDYTWVGVVPGHLEQAILVVDGEDLTGSVVTGGRYYAIRPIGGGLSVVALVDQQGFPADHPVGAYERLEQEAGPISMPFTPVPGKGMVEKSRDIAERACTYVDVVVAYTNTAKNQVANIGSLINLAVTETNQSYANVGIAHQIRLVHSYNTNYNDNSNMTTNRNRFRSNGDGYMDEIHSKRNTYGGDVAMLVQGSSGSSCGIAAAIYASSSTSFAVVAQNCATGYYSFGHEIGHLYGARHNTQADPTTTPFAYGHGYYYNAGGWRTVMSYNCPSGCTRMPWWSTPLYSAGGVALGTASTNDNRRVLNNTCSVLAGFK